MRAVRLPKMPMRPQGGPRLVFVGKAPPQAASATPMKGVRFRCNHCGASWPAFPDKRGNLCPADGCDDGGCPNCRTRNTAYDPTKGRPKLVKGEYAVEYQLKTFRYPTTTDARHAMMWNATKRVTLDECRVFYDGFDLLPPQGRVVFDYGSLERVLYCLRYNILGHTSDGKSRPRAWLKVVDHTGAHLKIEDLFEVFPAPSPEEPTEIEERFLPVDLKISILRTLCELGDPQPGHFIPAADGMSVEIQPTQEQLDALEHRRECLRRAGSPNTSTTLFHGTCAHNLPHILREGLRLSRFESGKALGPGIYLGLPPKALGFAPGCRPQHFIPKTAFKPESAYQYTIFNGTPEDGLKIPSYLTKTQRKRFLSLERLHLGVECEVLLGRSFYIDGSGEVPGDEGPRRALGRADSIYCTRFKQDEWCVFRRDQVLVRKIVVLKEDPLMRVS